MKQIKMDEELQNELRSAFYCDVLKIPPWGAVTCGSKEPIFDFRDGTISHGQYQRKNPITKSPPEGAIGATRKIDGYWYWDYA